MNQNRKPQYGYYVALIAAVVVLAVLIGVYVVRQDDEVDQYVDLNDNGEILTQEDKDVASVNAPVANASDSDSVANADSSDPKKIGSADFVKKDSESLAKAEPNSEEDSMGQEQHETKTEDSATTSEKDAISKKDADNSDDATKESEDNGDAKETMSHGGFSKKEKLSWPVQGNIILPYSMDTTIYFETLDVYKCNPGMMIASKEGTPVYAAFSGTVTDVSSSGEYGNMLTVDIGGGYSVTYGQLKDIRVAKGQEVDASEMIATIAKTTSTYTTEGDHLFLQMKKDGEGVDPSQFLQ